MPLRRAVVAAGLFGVALVAAGCGRQEITRTKLEHDFRATYENLLGIKRELLRTEIRGSAAAFCGREDPRVADAGSGEWRCRLRPAGKGVNAIEYEVEVTANGCWRATRRGFGARTVRDAATGRVVPDPVAGFDGCLRV